MPKRISRHILLFAISVMLCVVLYITVTSNAVFFRLSMATAYTAFILLGAALLIGPWYTFHGRRPIISNYIRRDIGVWAGILGITHSVVGLFVHFPDKIWLYFVYLPGGSHMLLIRTDLFGIANYTGLIASLILLLMLVLSNNVSLRTLGAERWKYLQQWIYIGVPLILIHGVIYQILENRKLAFVLLFSLLALILIVGQAAGYIRARRQSA